MDTPRRSYTFGPITVTIRRGEDDAGVRRFGLPTSVFVHLLIIALVVVLSTEQEKRAAEKAEEKKPPIQVTFYDPLPPPPKPTPPTPKPTRKPEPKFETTPVRPPPLATKPLRMQPAPDAIAQLKNAPKNSPRNAGQRDTRPAGGQAGGSLPKPANGVPESGSIGREVDAPRGSERADEPKDLQGRLRAFQRAVEEAMPPTSKGPKGGGSGVGGIEMPQMPETGFGVGNLQFEGNDYNWADYGTQIYWAILRAWYRRLLADSGVFERWASEKNRFLLEDTAGLRFTISRSGQIVDIAVERPSACYPLDDSAREALQEVVLPPLPADFERDSETVHARFVAEGPIRGMRQQLQMLHDAGWF